MCQIFPVKHGIITKIPLSLIKISLKYLLEYQCRSKYSSGEQCSVPFWFTKVLQENEFSRFVHDQCNWADEPTTHLDFHHLENWDSHAFERADYVPGNSMAFHLRQRPLMALPGACESQTSVVGF